MEIYIEKSELGFLNQLGGVNTKLPAYISGGTINPDSSMVAQAIQDYNYLAWVLEMDESFHEYSQSWAKYKRALTYGLNDGLPLGSPPILPTITVAPLNVPEKIYSRTEKFYQNIAHCNGFTQTIGEALGIVKPESSFVPGDGKPNLKVKLANGGHPLLHATKGKYDGFQIWKAVKGPTVTFSKLDTSMRADYLDSSALPATGEVAVWLYRAIYMYKNEVVGSWSDTVEVTVYGSV